ncbi:MAG: efflux RND transporter permease subunit [Acidimicrobiales bacterium]|nr:efflux RND transporter permease subunit [Acidimicrobiales bacterium]
MLTDLHPSEAEDQDPAASGEEVADPKNSVIARLGLLTAKYWPVTLALWVVLVAGGVFAFVSGLDREGFPPVDVPIVVVDGAFFVDDPAAVDELVATPLQEAYSEIEGVEEVTTISLPSAFFVVVQFESGFTSPDGAALLQPATDSVSLPPEAAVTVRPLDATKFLEVYDILVSVSGPSDATAADLEAEAAKIQEFLERTPGVIQADVRNLITEQVDPSTGEEVARQTRYTRTFFAGDDSYSPAIAVGLIRDPADTSLDILGFSDAVNARLDSADAPVLSDGYSAAITADFAVDIRTQVSSLIRNLVTGLIAVVIVSFVLIGWRASVITGLFMITVVMAALLGLMTFGYTLNTITLFGLILTLGLLVDDAIVIGESIDATKIEGGTQERILGVSLTRVALASMAGTLTTVLVFGPLLFIGGILGEFIRAIPVTVIITLLVSYIFSVVFIPAIGKFVLLRGVPSRSPIVNVQKSMARQLGRLAAFPARGGIAGVAVGMVLGLLPVAAIFGAGVIAGGLGFNIFPASKDANVLQVAVDFPPGITIEQAEATADEIDAIVVDVLGEDLLRSQYVRGNERISETFIDLVPFDERDTKAPVYRERLVAEMQAVQGARVTINVLDAGPPTDDLPFAVQIDADPATLGAAEALAEQMVTEFAGADIGKTSGEATSFTAVVNSSIGQVTRVDGRRYIEVRAGFSNDDLTANLTAAEDFVAERYTAAELEARGLPADALAFDFGQESDNADDFASLGPALLAALGLMFVLLIIQFRSLLQPVLVFLAIPFSFFGLTAALALTDNGISFFSGVGFIALIGVVVNNTILLVDSANQARREGLSIGDSIAQAVTRRFRPLVATAITTVAGLLPLALSDPFWEGLSFTLMGGLLSSTFLVLISFPVYYVVATALLELVKNQVVPKRRKARALAR